MNVQCAKCFWLGYFRVEQQRGGGTTYFHPESLPLNARDSLLAKSAFPECLQQLLARDNRIACLQEQTSTSGMRTALEPRFDTLVAQSDMEQIRDIALLTRECGLYMPFDPLLSFNDVLSLQEKQRTDRLADAVERRHRRQLYARLLLELDALAARDAISPQARGKEFEKWFAGVFAASQLRYTLDVRNDWEQLDFTVWLGDFFAIGEARWLKEAVDTPQMRDFFGKLMDRPPFVIGLLFSVNGFTEPSRNWAEQHTDNRTILMFDGELLRAALQRDKTLTETVFDMLNERLNRLGT